MLNENWLRSCHTTEEMAKGIYECVMANSWNFNEEGIKRWLKKEHVKSEEPWPGDKYIIKPEDC